MVRVSISFLAVLTLGKAPCGLNSDYTWKVLTVTKETPSGRTQTKELVAVSANTARRTVLAFAKGATEADLPKNPQLEYITAEEACAKYSIDASTSSSRNQSSQITSSRFSDDDEGHDAGEYENEEEDDGDQPAAEGTALGSSVEYPSSDASSYPIGRDVDVTLTISDMRARAYFDKFALIG